MSEVEKKANQSRIVLDLRSEKPIATYFYKGQFLVKSPFVNLAYKTVINRKPKRKDKTFDERMNKWQDDVNNKLLGQLTSQFVGGVYAPNFNLDTELEVLS